MAESGGEWPHLLAEIVTFLEQVEALGSERRSCNPPHALSAEMAQLMLRKASILSPTLAAIEAGLIGDFSNVDPYELVKPDERGDSDELTEGVTFGQVLFGAKQSVADEDACNALSTAHGCLQEFYQGIFGEQNFESFESPAQIGDFSDTAAPAKLDELDELIQLSEAIVRELRRIVGGSRP